MFSIFLGICLLATSFIFVPINPAPTAQDKTESDILYYENENDGKGNYEFSFATADDTKREEIGTVVNAGQPDQYIQVEGSYSYRYNTPGGYKWRMFEYTAGKEGFNITELMVIEGTLSGHIPPAALATLTG
ncbi:pupal cuticle protein 20-like [Aricia agestis]|uniref:pupal cuticle protein 20-like n=1 Tax=Aricia agestis TaxID=91739 RepID=UPI001C2081A9|nr:pupal cuticle protein 20-like [Aricia agestis]